MGDSLMDAREPLSEAELLEHLLRLWNEGVDELHDACPACAVLIARLDEIEEAEGVHP